MKNREVIPFVDLVTLHRELEEELAAVFQTSLRSGEFIGGEVVCEF